jgi:hypothetical protein
MPAQADIRTTPGIVVHDRIIAGKKRPCRFEGAEGDRHSGARIFAWIRNPDAGLDSGFARFTHAPE